MTLLETAAAMQPGERESYLRAACPSNELLIADLLERIRWREEMGDFLSEPWLAPAPEHLPFGPGELVNGRFRVLREVGRGAMGVVFEARDEKLGERRAIKCAKPRFNTSLPPEARSAMKVAHPNVCRLFEIHTMEAPEGSVDFLSMEFVEGTTLAAFLKRGSQVDIALLINLARQIAAGLAEAHRCGILHRDLKPSNIMITEQGSRVVAGPRAVITDFGLAREPAPAVSSDLRGAPDFVAPERWFGRPATAASDVYSLGVIFYELLTGQRPFEPGLSFEDKLTVQPTAPDRLREGVPKWISRVILRCLKADPADRFADGAAVSHALAAQERRGWLSGSLLAVAAAGLAVVAITRTGRVDPGDPARLAVAAAPVTDPSQSQEVEALLEDFSTRLTASRFRVGRISTIPARETGQVKASSAEEAASQLGATHLLTADAWREPPGRLRLSASIRDLRTGLKLKEFSHSYVDAELAGVPTALLGFTLGALDVTADQPVATIGHAAYPAYFDGLALLSHARRTHTGFDAALARFEEALRLEPQSALVRAGRAQALLDKYDAVRDRGALEKARFDAAELARLNPDRTATLLLSGRLSLEAGEPEESARLFERATKIEPGNPMAWSGLARSLAEMRSQSTRAATAFRRAIELQPRNHVSYYEFAVFHLRLGDYDQAERLLKEAIARNPKAALPHSGLGGLYMDRGRYADAERELRTSLEILETPFALNNLAAGLAYQDRDAEAVPLYQRAKAIGPENHLHNMNLADSLRRIGRTREAARAYQRCHDMAREAMLQKPSDGYTRSFFSYCAARLGHRAAAEDNIEQALRFSRQDVKVIRRAVITYEALGNRAKALALLSEAPKDLLAELARQPDLAGLRRDSRYPRQ